MTITAKNYAAQAERGLERYIAQSLRSDILKQDIPFMIWLKENIARAQHFVVEDGGVMFDDQLKGMKGVELRLPFPSITIEYFNPVPEILNDENPAYLSKMVVLACEFTAEQVIETFHINFTRYGDESRVIMVTFAGFYEDIQEWVPAIGMLLVPQKWDDTSQVVEDIWTYDKEKAALLDGRSKQAKGRDIGILGSVYPLMPSMCMAAAQEHGIDKVKESIAKDVVAEVRVVLELCEALTCRNVKISEYSPAAPNNAKRIRQGKAPIYETKFLTVESTLKVPAVNSAGYGASTRERNSPRMHLRRGHIRRLPDRNIWVNSSVVGAIEKGQIDKQYRLRK